MLKMHIWEYLIFHKYDITKKIDYNRLFFFITPSKNEIWTIFINLEMKNIVKTL